MAVDILFSPPLVTVRYDLDEAEVVCDKCGISAVYSIAENTTEDAMAQMMLEGWRFHAELGTLCPLCANDLATNSIVVGTTDRRTVPLLGVILYDAFHRIVFKNKGFSRNMGWKDVADFIDFLLRNYDITPKERNNDQQGDQSSAQG